jgi:putative aldouronate transport system substrate-binding protein
MRLSNFGIEGESYNLKDGKPIFTDYILKNPQGLTMKQAMARYLTDGLGYYPGVQLKDPVQQQRFFPAQNLAIEAWMDGDVNWRVPPVSPSAAESAAYAKIMTDVKTYVDESYAKFVMGTMPISEYDTFVANLKKMGIEDAIKILQNSVDRFNKR